MYRLLIVDDEPKIRKGMLSCIDWGAYGIGEMKEASNGADALHEALSFCPHILLADIRMPIMDGIELSYRIREKLPDCKIIIMSGYDEFAYAKSLMRMKVTDYLLKPVDENELMHVISRLINEIREEEAYQSNKQTASLLLHENLPQLKSNFMQKILDGSFADIGKMTEYATVLHLHIPTSACEFRAIVLSAESLNTVPIKGTIQESESLASEMIHIAEDLINQAASGFLCRSDSNSLIGMIYGLPDNYDISTLDKDIQYLIKEQMGIAVLVSIGPTVQSASEINHSYQQALSTLDEKRYKGKRNIVQIALRYMEEHYSADISLSDVADIAFVTPNYLSRIFKEEMNMNFIDYLNLLRLEKAKQLLLHTNLKTYEIAEKVGYKDYKYFSAMLKKLTGFSPREYRRS
ncbi:MAG: response regulator [Oscillospiraceae bacterium]|nr:response regulator [Oscillospiraceae bacterium]